MSFIKDIFDIGKELISGNQDRQQQKEQNRLNAELNASNEALQREFAQQGIRWKVADAEAAGIHPLAALGAQTFGFAPHQVGESALPPAVNFRNMGQNLSRSWGATRTAEERMAERLRLENMQLQNDMLREDLRSRVNDATNPGFPDAFNSDGQVDGRVVEVSNRIPSRARGAPHQEAGYRPDVSFTATPYGAAPMIPQGISESLEDDFIGKLAWRIRNNLYPNLGVKSGAPSKKDLPSWADDWSWSKVHQTWRPIKRKEMSGRWRYSTPGLRSQFD